MFVAVTCAITLPDQPLGKQPLRSLWNDSVRAFFLHDESLWFRWFGNLSGRLVLYFFRLLCQVEDHDEDKHLHQGAP